MKKQANNVLRLSEEIRRLRHKCSEEVWNSAFESEEDWKKEKQAYDKINAEKS